MKNKTKDGSYIHNCFIKRRLDDVSGALFEIPPDGSKMITKLDGYSIIPIEEYKRLIDENFEP